MTDGNIAELLKLSCAPDISAAHKQAAKDHWDRVSKPLDSMGDFEEIISRIGGIQRKDIPSVKKAAVIVFASDNGIVEEGISQSDRSITALCASDIADGKKSVNVMAKACGVDVCAVDVGVAMDMASDRIINKNIRKGSRNFLKEPAMTKDETLRALQAGMDMAGLYFEKGYDLIGIGEMGIGNTTTSSAVTASLLKLDPVEVTGRGAGLNNAGLKRKIEVITEAIDKYSLYGADTLKVLSCVGGYDIAAMAGCCLGAAYYGIPMVLDGVISNVAALVAERLLRGTAAYLIPSHRSRERACDEILKELKLHPVIDAGMALGEGTGAVMMISLIRTAYEVFSECTDFEQARMEAYTHFDEE